MGKKKWFWMVACLAIAALSIWAVVSQTKSFDWELFQADVLSANKWWLFMSLLSMFCFILCEGLAVRCILKVIAPEWRAERNCVLYAAADIYFSAITPSATGGQPIMGFFMKRDGLSIAAITSSLILNLILYTVGIFFICFCGIIIRPGFFFAYTALSKTMIIIGISALIIMTVGFWLMLFRKNLLDKIINGVFRFLTRFIHFKNVDEKKAKIQSMISEYQKCAVMMSGERRMILKVLGWNVLQRLGQSLVSVFLFLAIGGGSGYIFDVWLAQIFSIVGSSSVPIPGGMGAADYLLIDGFTQIPAISSAANMALLSRGISFYSCVILSAVIVLIGYLGGRKSDRNL